MSEQEQERRFIHIEFKEQDSTQYTRSIVGVNPDQIMAAAKRLEIIADLMLTQQEANALKKAAAQTISVAVPGMQFPRVQ